MKSLYNFIVTPLGGKYKTSKKLKDKVLYLTASIENAKDVNRYAVVVSTPIFYKGDIKEGDVVILHHNIFRDFYNHKGKVSNSASLFRDDLFFAYPDLVYLYDSGDGWSAHGDYCFVKGTSPLCGEIIYSNDIETGSNIGFTPDSEYEFDIDGEILYRMKTSDICLIE